MHTFIPPPPDDAGGASPSLNAEHTAAIRRWTREILRLPDDAVVTVSELACRDAGCPLVETAVTVFEDSQPTRLWKFTRPNIAVTKLMLHQTLATLPKTSRASAGR